MNQYSLVNVLKTDPLYPLIEDMITSYDNNWNTNSTPRAILDAINNCNDKDSDAYKLLIATSVRVYSHEIPESMLVEFMDLDDFEVKLDEFSTSNDFNFKDVLRYNIVNRTKVSKEFGLFVYNKWADENTMDKMDTYRHVQWCKFCLMNLYKHVWTTELMSELAKGLDSPAKDQYKYVLRHPDIWEQVYDLKDTTGQHYILNKLSPDDLEASISAHLPMWVSDPRIGSPSRAVINFINWSAGTTCKISDTFDIKELRVFMTSLKQVAPSVYNDLSYGDRLARHHYQSAMQAVSLAIDYPNPSLDELTKQVESIEVTNTWISHWIPLFKETAINALFKAEPKFDGDHWWRIVNTLSLDDIKELNQNTISKLNELICLPVYYDEFDGIILKTADLEQKFEALNIDLKTYKASLDLGSTLLEAVRIGYQSKLMPDSEHHYDLTF